MRSASVQQACVGPALCWALSRDIELREASRWDELGCHLCGASLLGGRWDKGSGGTGLEESLRHRPLCVSC